MSTTIRDVLAQRDQQLATPPASLYFDTPAGPLWSAATIAERTEPREQFLRWVTWQTAILAHTHAETLAGLGVDAPGWLRQQLLADRDAAGIMGRAVHRALDADILGAPRPPATPEQQAFLDAFDRFCQDHQPAWESAAVPVAHVDAVASARWAGRADFFATIDGNMVVGDFTTARRIDVAAFKLVGLAMCETAWVGETEVEPPDLDGAVILHLRPDLYLDTGYRLIHIDTKAGAEAFEAAALLMHLHSEMPPLYTAPAGGA